jgi:glycerophosphoryl diester phosphodiesterase
MQPTKANRRREAVLEEWCLLCRSWVDRPTARQWSIVAPRLPSVLSPPIAFADGGASAQLTGHTIGAFELALRLGASGLHTTVWASADGVPVCNAGPSIPGPRLRRRRPIRGIPLHSLPHEMATLEAVVDQCDPPGAVMLSIGDPDILEATLQVIRGHQERTGVALVERIWIHHDDLDQIRRWRSDWPTVRLVAGLRLAALPRGPERAAADLAAAGIDAVRLSYDEWTGGLTTLFHKFEILAFAAAVEHDRMLDELLVMGIDAVSSAHVDRLSDAMRRAGY